MKQDLQGKLIYFPRSADATGEKDRLLACKPFCRSDSDGGVFYLAELWMSALVSISH